MVEEETAEDLQEENPEEYTRTPWMLKEIRRARLSDRLRLLVLGIDVIIGIYIMFKLFEWFFLFGLLPAPAWYFWALRQIDRESYTLIEVRLKGDHRDGKVISHDTQTNIYQIPPDIWKEIEKKGTPFTPGQRIYICDKFDLENEIVYFSDDERLSNMTFWTRLDIWMRLKAEIPGLERKLAIYMYDADRTAHKIAFDILQEAGTFHRSNIKEKTPWVDIDKELKTLEGLNGS